MVDAKDALKMESTIALHCGAIMKADSDWEVKNTAVLALTAHVKAFKAKNVEQSVVHDLFGMNIFRLLKEPLQST
jgi:hypothetical protein